MRRLLVLTIVLATTACEETASSDARKKVATTIDHVARGRAQLSGGRADLAVKSFKQAISISPQDVSLYLLLAQAYQASGNEAGAALTLKQADEISEIDDPAIRRQRAELLIKMHQSKAAVVELIVLRDDDLLTDREVIDLTRMLARMGRIDEAFKTLEKIQQRSADDADAKTMEAEILFMRGDVVTAAKIIDRLLNDIPGLTAARLLRARYFLNEGQLDQAQEDLTMIDAADTRRPEVVALQATVLNELGRSDEAATLLEHRIEIDPNDVDSLALLAETRLLQGRANDAKLLVDKVLALDPRWARALYVRGRAFEQQNRLEEALRDYQAALNSDSSFAPALKRVWRVQDRLGSKGEAITALEQLFFQNDIDAEERIQLARYYAETWANVERGVKLINEALKKDPKNPEFLSIKARLVKGNAGKVKKRIGPEIIRGTRH